MSGNGFFGVEGIPYYRVNPANKRAYWCPSWRMRKFGFEVRALGVDGPEARQLSQEWTAKWHAARKEPSGTLGPWKPPEPAKQPPEPNSKKQYVYFLRVGERIKIGVSRSPLSRLHTILEYATDRFTQAVIVRGNRSDENRLHRRFKNYQSRGEWYRACRPLQLTIMRCAAAGAVVHDEAEAGTEIPAECESPRKRVESHSRRGALNG